MKLTGSRIRNWLRNLIRYAIKLLLIISLLLVLIPILLALPPVKKRIIREVNQKISVLMQGDFSLGNYAYVFPAGIALKELSFHDEFSDVQIPALKVRLEKFSRRNNKLISNISISSGDIFLSALTLAKLASEEKKDTSNRNPKNWIIGADVKLEQTFFTLSNKDTVQVFSGGAQSIDINNARVQLAKRVIEWGKVELDGGCASVIAGVNQEPVTKKKPGGWIFQGKTVKLSDTFFDLQILPDKIFLASSINSILVKSSAIDLSDKSIQVKGLHIDGIDHLNLIKPDTLQNQAALHEEREAFAWDIQLTSGNLKNINFFHSGVGQAHIDTVFSPDYLAVSNFGIRVKEARISPDKVKLFADDFSVDFNQRVNLRDTKISFESGDDMLTSRIKSVLNETHLDCDIKIVEDHRKILQAKYIPSGKVSLGIQDLNPSMLDYFIADKSILHAFHSPVSIDLEGLVDNNWAEISLCKLRIDSLGEISIHGELDQLNVSDSMMFQLSNSLNIYPSFFRQFLSDTSGIADFLPDEFFAIEGNVIGSPTSVHTRQNISSDYAKIPFEASFFLNDSSFDFSTKEMKLWADSLFSIPLKIHSADLKASGNVRGIPQISVEGTFYQVGLLDQLYSGVRFNSIYSGNVVDGNISISDSLLQSDLQLVLSVDSGLSASVKGDISFRLDSINDKINTLELASTMDISYQQLARSQSATALFSNVYARLNNEPYSLDTVHLALDTRVNYTLIDLETDFLDAHFLSQLSTDSLFARFKKAGLSKTPADTITLVDRFASMPAFECQTLIRSHPILEVFVPAEQFTFDGLDFQIVSSMDGEIRSSLKLNAPQSASFEMDAVTLETNFISGRLIYDARLDGIVREKMAANSFRIQGEAMESFLSTQIVGIDETEDVKFQVGIEAEKDSSLYSIHILYDTLIFYGNRWSINPDNRISFSRDTIREGNLILTQGEKKVILQSGRLCPLQLDIQNLELEAISSVFQTKSDIAGIMNATICFTDQNYSDIQSTLEFVHLNIDGRNLGDYTLNNTLSHSDTSQIYVSGNIVHGKDEKLQFTSSIDMNSLRNSALNLSVNDLSVQPIQLFTADFIHEIEGTVTGNVSFDGKSESPLKGALEFNNLMINPKMVNSRLRFTDNSILLKDRKIELKRMPIVDEQGKRMFIEGELDFIRMGDPHLRLLVQTDSMQMLNIADKKNNPFFGRIIASNLLYITGPVSSPDIDLNLRLIRGTDFTFRITEDLKSYEGEGIVNFVSEADHKEDEVGNSVILKSGKNEIDLNTKIIIDPETKLRLQYTENMDFDIVLSGNGDIVFNRSRTGKESMVGSYTVRRGQAVLKLQGLAPKDFNISPQSYLRWDGDVENPIVDIQAIYTVKGSYENPSSGNSSTIIVDYDVLFAFKNRLNKPEIVFDLTTKDQYMTTVLNGMTKEERTKQAINVLLLGYIVTPETQGGASKILTDHINQFWTSQLNSAADKNLGGVEVSVDIQSITNYSAGNAQDQTNLSYEVKKDLWNDRATVKVGGYVRTYTSSPQDATSRLIGDFSLEYKLNKKENLYGKVFSENKYEGILEGEIQRTGAGIMYRQSYNSMSEIWKKRRQKRATKKKSKSKILEEKESN